MPETEQPHLDLVLLQLAKRRRKTFKQVKQLLKGDRYKKIKQALTTWVEEPTYKAIAALPADQAMPDLVLPLVSQLWLHPGWLFGTKAVDTRTESTKAGSTKAARSGIQVHTQLSQADVDQLISDQGTVLHSLRKQVKRVRYQLRLVADLYPSALEGDIERLSDLQDTLGDLQDSTVLEDFIAEVVPNARAQMPQLFALLADRRHHAWKQWQSHQQHYLDAAQRQRLRLALLHPGQQPDEAPEVEQPLAPNKGKDKETTEKKNGSAASPSRHHSPAQGKASGTKKTPHQAKPAPEGNAEAG